MKEQMNISGSGTVSLAGSGTTAILSTSASTGSSTTYIVPNHNPLHHPSYVGFSQAGEIVNPYEDYQSFKDMMDRYKASANPTTASESLEKMISDMEGSENELQQTAVKHMKYAKAYLDKMMLEIINERL